MNRFGLSLWWFGFWFGVVRFFGGLAFFVGLGSVSHLRSSSPLEEQGALLVA